MLSFSTDNHRKVRRTASVAALALATVLTPVALTTPGASAQAAASQVTEQARSQVRLSGDWSGSRFVVGAKAVVRGYAGPAAAVERVQLQRRTPDGWRTVKSVDPGSSRYSLRIPTGWFGRFTYRVRAVSSGATATTTRQRIRVVPSYDPRGSARTHEFAADPVARWDPCRTIGYRVNAKQAGSGAVKDLKAALRRVHQATGLRFAYRGTTDVIPQDFYNTYAKGTDLVIAWARPSQSPLLAASGGAMGVGGAAWTFGFENADGTAASRIDSGYVVIDSTQQRRAPAGFGKGKTRGELLMHELGHAIGLQHVDDRRQLMYPLLQPGKAHWGAGDLAGLEDLGLNRGCLS